MVSPRSVTIRHNNLRKEIETIENSLCAGAPTGKSPRSFRYLASLCTLPVEQAAEMRAWLRAYRDFLESGA